MNLQATLVMILAVAAGPAAAQGTFSPGKKPGSLFGSSPSASGAKAPSFTPPAPATASARARPAAPPEAPRSPGFEPYKPFKGSSVYSSSSKPAAGARPCETSVYVNACDPGR